MPAAYEAPSNLPWTSWEHILCKWPELTAFKSGDPIDVLIEEILHIPITMMSEKINGLDDRPLGISMAIRYQRRGKVSLWHDCLLPLVPGPLRCNFWNKAHIAVSESLGNTTNDVEPVATRNVPKIQHPIVDKVRLRTRTPSSDYSSDEKGEPVSDCYR